MSPFIIPIILFCCGILAFDRLSALSILPSTHYLIPALALAAALVLFSRKKRYFFVALCAFFFLLGALRYSSWMVHPSGDIGSYAGSAKKEVMLRGVITNDPELKGSHPSSYWSFVINAERIMSGDTEEGTSGKVLIKLYREDVRPAIGDRIVTSGRLFLPPGRKNPYGFDYGGYLKREGITAFMSSTGSDLYQVEGVSSSPILAARRFICGTRKRAGRILGERLPGLPGAIMSSVIIGERGGLGLGDRELFARTGTMHILAVSGLHVAIVAAVFLAVFRLAGIPRRVSYVLTILAICFFAVFAGMRPATVRAAIMGSFMLANLSLGRRTDTVGALFLSAFFITFFLPAQLLQPGFVLSYLAVLSIIYITPLTDPLFGLDKPERPHPMTGYILKCVSVSLAVWIGLMPVTAAYFHIITPSVVITNLFAVPVLFALVALGLVIVILGSTGIFALVAVFPVFLAKGLCHFLVRALQIVAGVPCAYIRVASPGFIQLAAYYIGLAGIIVLFTRRKSYRTLVAVFLLFAANIFIWQEVYVTSLPDNFKATFFDVGKADASIVEFSDGKVLIIDGGLKDISRRYDAGRSVLAPYLWQKGIRRVDCVLLTHSDGDHLGGLLYILENFKVGAVVESFVQEDGGEVRPLYGEFDELVRKKDISRLKVRRGDIVTGFGDARLVVLNPSREGLYGSVNDDSIIFELVTANDKSIIYCADAGSVAMKDILKYGSLLASDGIKVPHHGGKIGDVAVFKAFLEEVDPEWAIVPTTGTEKMDKDVLRALNSRGINVYITGYTGAIVVEEDDGMLIPHPYDFSLVKR